MEHIYKSSTSYSKSLLYKKLLLTCIAIIGLFSCSVFAQTFNVAAGNFNVAANWTPAVIPTGASAIIIPTGDVCTIPNGYTY
ncbi:MAG TPA: hypothetical protein VK705_08935, partial [Ferruginibacter sp.]|nr:hypothetical protein [Ferruginibacter sp.]